MAFWAIEKVKNLSGIISTKDVSEKIKTYMVTALYMIATDQPIIRYLIRPP